MSGSEFLKIRQQVFIREVPSGTWVFKDDTDHFLWGRTVGGEIYASPESPFVRVSSILGFQGRSGQWEWENVVKMGQDERKERLLVE